MLRTSILLAAAVGVGAAIILIERKTELRGARLFECLLVFGLLACAARASHGRLRDAMVTLCSLAFGIAAIEGISLLIAARPAGTEAVTRDDGLVKSRPIFGWGPSHPGVFRLEKIAADGRVIYDVHATIDEAWNRRTRPSHGPRPVAFFGDSFVFGDGLGDDATLPQAFADLFHGRIPVLNLGFSGWSPSQNLFGLQSGAYASQLAAPRRMILFTATFHIERTACKGAFAAGSGPRYVLDGGDLRYAGTCAGSRSRLTRSIMSFARRFALGERIVPAADQITARDVETYLNIIESFAATARRDYKTGTTVLLAPTSDAFLRGIGYSEAKIVDALRGAGVDVLVESLPSLPDMSVYKIEGDQHPTALANQATARQLEAHIRGIDPGALDTGTEAAERD